MQHICNHDYSFERCVSPIILEEHIVFMIWIVRDYVKDHLSFYVFSLKNKGVIAVNPKKPFMTSRDRKCIREARKWSHAVRILLAIVLVFTMNSLAQKLTEKIGFS